MIIIFIWVFQIRATVYLKDYGWKFISLILLLWFIIFPLFLCVCACLSTLCIFLHLIYGRDFVYNLNFLPNYINHAYALIEVDLYWKDHDPNLHFGSGCFSLWRFSLTLSIFCWRSAGKILRYHFLLLGSLGLQKEVYELNKNLLKGLTTNLTIRPNRQMSIYG